MNSFRSPLIVIKTQEVLNPDGNHPPLVKTRENDVQSICADVSYSRQFCDFQRMEVDKVSLEGKDRVAAILENGRCPNITYFKDNIMFVIFKIRTHTQIAFIFSQ